MTLSSQFLPYPKLNDLIQTLQKAGYEVQGPTVQNETIVYDVVTSADDLPWGYQDTQAPAHYAIQKTDVQKAFGFTVPVQSVKPHLFKAQETLFKVTRDSQGKLAFTQNTGEQNPVAILGIRPCDLRAIHIQDRVFMENQYADERYQTRREKLFTIAVNCTDCHSNCFCLSVGGAPKAQSGFDLAMTEISDGFVIESGSNKGKVIVDQLGLSQATEEQINLAQAGIAHACEKQTKTIPDPERVARTLKSASNHPQWNDVARRCLSCGSCTNMCPTCFCHTQLEQASLDGSESEHVREWSSCFGLDHSYTHAGAYRAESKYRYRQWLTHKFSAWQDQFDVGGCVGCGRCITWCPVKIDVTEEINAICDHPDKQAASGEPA